MLLATAGYDYVLSGYRWTNPSQLSYSVASDGVYWSHGTNNLNAALNAKVGPGVWQRAFALALATWESVANINIAQVADSALSFGTPGQKQSDPRFGDIRIGGYDFGSSGSSTLAQTYYPPPQGMTEAGDLEINTGMNYTNGGAGYDFFSVMLHEVGHALGLGHAPNPQSVMYYQYQGVRTGLQAGDIAGIQALYGARTPDPYQGQGRGVDWTSAIDVTGNLGAGQQAILNNVSLARIGDTEYFSVVAPPNAGGSLQVVASASNRSLLSPKVSLFDGSGRLLDTEATPWAWSNTVAVDASQVVPGQRYLIAVTGATNDAFAVGSYQLQVTFAGGGTSGTPWSPPPGQTVNPGTPTPTPTPTPPIGGAVVGPDRFEPNNSFGQATNLGVVAKTSTSGNLTLDTGADVDYFTLRSGRPGVYRVVANGALVQVFDGKGRRLAIGGSEVSLRVFRPRTPLYVTISSATGLALENYSLTVAAQNARVRLPAVARGRRGGGR
jgi:predicted Zn-dependent protease